MLDARLDGHKIMSRAKNWCFTLNNPTDDEKVFLSTLVGANTEFRYLIYGNETGEEGTPHLQGFFSLLSRKRMLELRKTLGNRFHLENARNPNAAIQYCKKENDWVDFGEMGTTTGKRSDLEEFKVSVKAGELDPKNLRDIHSDVFAKYPRFCHDYIQDHYPVKEVPQHDLKEWQSSLKQILDSEPDDRTVVFVVDEIGNAGKSWFAHWYTQNVGKSQVLLPGKKADMAYTLDPTIRVLFMDAPRSKQGEYLMYDFLEDVKNGYVFSSKYESRVKRLSQVHVVVNMNEEPDMTKLSRDRYNVIHI
jgi:hypothetical protein